MTAIYLGINTVIDPIGFTICSEGKVLSQRQQTSTKAFTENMIVMINEECRALDVALSQIKAIGVITGPGSYTGIRIGITYAKTLEMTHKMPIYGLSSFQALANQVIVDNSVFGVIVPGKKHHLNLQLMNGKVEKAAMSNPVSLQYKEVGLFLDQFNVPLSLYGVCDDEGIVVLQQHEKARYHQLAINTSDVANYGKRKAELKIESEGKNLMPYYFHEPTIGSIKEKNKRPKKMFETNKKKEGS